MAVKSLITLAPDVSSEQTHQENSDLSENGLRAAKPVQDQDNSGTFLFLLQVPSRVVKRLEKNYHILLSIVCTFLH
jgi:hypothetical protein